MNAIDNVRFMEYEYLKLILLVKVKVVQNSLVNIKKRDLFSLVFNVLGFKDSSDI